MPLTIVVGALYGDEGKGRVVHAMARDFSVIARATGGANVSHTVVHRGARVTLRQVPCGVFAPRATCCTGDGMVLDPIPLVDELAMLERHGVSTARVRIAEPAVVVTALHQAVDRAREERAVYSDDAIGTTRQGESARREDRDARLHHRAVGVRQGARQRTEQEGVGVGLRDDVAALFAAADDEPVEGGALWSFYTRESALPLDEDDVVERLEAGRVVFALELVFDADLEILQRGPGRRIKTAAELHALRARGDALAGPMAPAVGRLAAPAQGARRTTIARLVDVPKKDKKTTTP